MAVLGEAVADRRAKAVLEVDLVGVQLVVDARLLDGAKKVPVKVGIVEKGLLGRES